MSKKTQEDQIAKVFTVTVEGISFDSMVEKARLQGAKVFEVDTGQIYVKTSGFRPARMTPFRANLGIESRPETWQLDVLVGVNDRDED